MYDIISLNDKELEPISEGCRYTYALGNVRTKNVLKMTVNSNFINNASKILSQIVFVQINNNGKSATTCLTGQPPTYRPNSGKSHNTPQY
uniref:Uncharacterized protein n=1 Tax=Acrobeloides nanus TaxID=290746 RepID=A0A914E0R8_9BILA